MILFCNRLLLSGHARNSQLDLRVSHRPEQTQYRQSLSLLHPQRRSTPVKKTPWPGQAKQQQLVRYDRKLSVCNLGDASHAHTTARRGVDARRGYASKKWSTSPTRASSSVPPPPRPCSVCTVSSPFLVSLSVDLSSQESGQASVQALEGGRGANNHILFPEQAVHSTSSCFGLC